jgi:hypothetical protein
MKNARFIVLTIAVVIAGLAIALAVVYKVVESKLFDSLLNQPGIQVSIGSRHGNLFSGYTLNDVSFLQTETHGEMPATGFRTQRLAVHWKLRPFAITEISWDRATLTLVPGTGSNEEIPIGEGKVLPTDPGWLDSESPVTVGPDTWDGTANIRIRADVKDLKVSVEIQRLPGRIVRLVGAPPEGFDLPNEVFLTMEFEGSPPNLKASGRVSDPFTRRSYNF